MVDWISNGESGASVRAKLNTIPASLLAAGLTVGSSAIASGTTGRVLYDNAGTVGEALIRYSAANLFLGGADAASPTAQTLSVQNVATGTANTAGADWTIAGSKGTGTGAPGLIVFKTAPAGGTGSTQNALAAAMTVGSVGAGYESTVTFASRIGVDGAAPSSAGISIACFGTIYAGNGNAAFGAISILGQGSAFLYSPGYINLHAGNATPIILLGDDDAAAPVAQTLTVQSVVAGTSNTAGANWTIAGSKGTGTGVGGSIIFKTAPAGSTGTSQNTLGTAMTIDSAGLVSITAPTNLGGLAITTSVGGTRTLSTSGGNLSVDGGLSIINDIHWGNGWGLLTGGNTGVSLGQIIAGTGGFRLLTGADGTLFIGAADIAAPVAQTTTVQSVVAGTSDTAGTAWTFQASKGTGTAAGGNIVDQTAFSAKSTGSGQGTAIDRKVIVAKGKVLTDNTPVSLFEIALPTLSMCGGQIEATVVCTNGTDMQSFTQTISYSAVNKGGVYTKSITASTGDKSVSGGSTIANTWTLLDGTNKVTVQLSSDTSLTPSSNAFLVYYSIKNNSEQATTIL